MRAGPTRKRSRVANLGAVAAVVAALTGVVVMRRVAGTGSPTNEVVYQLGSALIAGGVVAPTFMDGA